MKKLFGLLCAVLLLSLASSSFALDPIQIGNFEDPAVNSRYENWMISEIGNFTSTTVTTPAVAVTLGTKALKLVDATGGWDRKISMPFGEYGQTLEANARANAMVQENSAWSIDVTAFPGEVVGPVTLALHGEGGGLTWGLQTPEQSIIVDGQPHTYVIVIPQNVKDALPTGINSYYCNLGFGFQTGSGSTTIYLDNIWIYPDGAINIYLPHDGKLWSQAKVGSVENDTLNWQAAADPNKDRGLPVEPNIVDQYVFINNGATDASGDILYYHGKTGVDPGTEPNSFYGPITLQLNKAYKWAVVDAIAGHTQTFTTSNTLANVDPNNLIGPIWRFNSINTLPVITTPPVNGRAPLGATNVEAFTIGVAEPDATYYQWYKSADNVIDLVDSEPTDFKIATASGTTKTLILGTGVNGITMSNQAYYYCKVYNLTTISGGGTFPDVYSNVVSFVVERKIAEYKFNNNLNDTADVITDLHIGTGVGGPTFVADSIEGGYALSLNGTDQYVTLAAGAYPKAIMMSTGGIAGGLDIGSILCWVKATKAGAIMANADPNNGALLQIGDSGNASITVRGLNSTYVGSASAMSAPNHSLINDGNWHLVAATWDPDNAVGMRMSVDTVSVEVNANTASFAPWMYSMLIGANRPNDADYSIPGDFFGGLLDNLRVYNYVISPEEIAQEYYTQTGVQTCIYPAFTGSNANLDNTGASFCKVDLADFAAFAESWLTEGFYP